jgi:Transposase DDE domain
VDPETFLVEVYVLADEFCKTRLPPERHPGPAAALARSEVVTLGVFSQWARFGSERDFWRYTERRLRPYFPHLPSRPQFNRQLRRQHEAVSGFALWLAAQLGADTAPYEAIDGSAVPTRNAKRRGRGWLAGIADIGRCLRRGWIEGLRLLVCATPDGTVTGWGVGPASTNDRALAETVFAQRAGPEPAPDLPSVGQPASGVYVADSGFAGVDCEARWVSAHQAQVVAPPQPHGGRRWSRAERRWLAGKRQIVETVIGRLEGAFRLERERPHTLDGFLARLAAKMALHNVCLWLNRQRGQPALALAALFGW